MITSTPDCDIAIVGGGLSGTIAAVVLGRAGYAVTLVDRNDVFPAEFRVEKIGGDQTVKLERLGLLPALAANATRFDEVVNARKGRVLDRTVSPYYGILYQDLVHAMRQQIPANVRRLQGRVVDIVTAESIQTITVAEHGPISSRLVVLASGMSDILRSRLGVERDVLHERQSVTFGFNLAPTSAATFAQPAFTYYGGRPADGVDYITLFPVAGATRANLFSFLDYRDPWIKAMRTDPTATLSSTLPGLERLIGPYEVVGKVQNWIQDLSVARNVRQAGVVLIGDAFQTSCPAAGTGVSRLLTDIEQLCRTHIPAWLASPGMAAAKIAAFYDDPRKQAMDAHALNQAYFRRSLTVDSSLAGRARRQLLYTRRRLMNGLERVSPSLAAGLRSFRSRAAAVS